MTNTFTSEQLAQIFKSAKYDFSLVAEVHQTDTQLDYSYCSNSPHIGASLDEIFTKLMTEVCRFCDTNASDLIPVISEILRAGDPAQPDRTLLVGIHSDGIDLTNSIADRISSGRWDPYYYRRIYGLQIRHQDNRVFVELRNLGAAMTRYISEEPTEASEVSDSATEFFK